MFGPLPFIAVREEHDKAAAPAPFGFARCDELVDDHLHPEMERALGEVLGWRRDQVVLATKFGGKGVDMGYERARGAKGSRAYIRRAVAESLRGCAPTTSTCTSSTSRTR